VTESNETDFSTNELKEWRILHVSHGVRWETEPGVWRDEQFMFSVSDTQPGKSAGTRAVILSRDEAVAFSKWLNKALERKAKRVSEVAGLLMDRCHGCRFGTPRKQLGVFELDRERGSAGVRSCGCSGRGVLGWLPGTPYL
jgi:hypothetical protein